MRERWVTVWPPPKEVAEKQDMLIEDEQNSCDFCRVHFGWVRCRKGEYQKLAVVKRVHPDIYIDPWVVGAWNITHDNFQVIGSFALAETALEAYQHLNKNVAKRAESEGQKQPEAESAQHQKE